MKLWLYFNIVLCVTHIWPFFLWTETGTEVLSQNPVVLLCQYSNMVSMVTLHPRYLPVLSCLYFFKLLEDFYVNIKSFHTFVDKYVGGGFPLVAGEASYRDQGGDGRLCEVILHLSVPEEPHPPRGTRNKTQQSWKPHMVLHMCFRALVSPSGSGIPPEEGQGCKGGPGRAGELPINTVTHSIPVRWSDGYVVFCRRSTSLRGSTAGRRRQEISLMRSPGSSPHCWSTAGEVLEPAGTRFWCWTSPWSRSDWLYFTMKTHRTMFLKVYDFILINLQLSSSKPTTLFW